MVDSSNHLVHDGGHDPETGHYTTRFEQFSAVPSAVVGAVATVVDTEATALPPLRDIIDPDSLTAMLRPSADVTDPTELAVSFTYECCRVTVTRRGLIEVVPPPESDTDAAAP